MPHTKSVVLAKLMAVFVGAFCLQAPQVKAAKNAAPIKKSFILLRFDFEFYGFGRDMVAVVFHGDDQGYGGFASQPGGGEMFVEAVLCFIVYLWSRLQVLRTGGVVGDFDFHFVQTFVGHFAVYVYFPAEDSAFRR
jgi:hypothetical protein